MFDPDPRAVVDRLLRGTVIDPILWESGGVAMAFLTRVRGEALGMGMAPDAAQDAAEDCLLVLKRYSELGEPIRLSLHAVTRSILNRRRADWLRDAHRGSTPRADGQEEAPERADHPADTQVLGRELADATRRLIDELPAKQRSTMRLLWAGISRKVIAELEEADVKTVDNRLHEAREFIIDRLGRAGLI